MNEKDKGCRVETGVAGKGEPKRRDASSDPDAMVPPVGEEGTWLPS